MSSLEGKVELSLLFDFYGALLREDQREIMTMYFYDDMSLSEIAENAGITRQGVHDIIKRAGVKLSHYEDMLHLYDKYLMDMEKLEKIKRLTEGLDGQIANQITALCDEIKNNGI